MMNVKIKRIDPSLPLPQYYTKGAVGFDIYSRRDCIIKPNSIARICTNLVIEVPEGYMLYIKDRSSTAGKGLISTAGIIDQDYCGPDDEILFQVYNYTDKDTKIHRGERVAQGIFVRVDQIQWQEAEGVFMQKNRGGFGSSGERV